MKKIIYLLIIVTSVSFSQNQEATLHFKDGTSIKGYASIQGYKINFRIEKGGETSIWTGEVVKGITFHEFERDVDFEYTFTKSFKRTPVLLKVLVFGEVKLYIVSRIVNPVQFSGFGDNSSSQYKVNKYYVRRESEPYASRLKGAFKKSIKKYFGECSGITKRINNHEFRWTTLTELVIYYNSYCVDF